MNKRFFMSLILLTCFFYALPCTTVYGGQDQPFLPGVQLPGFTLPAADSQQSLSYLGLGTTEPHTISQIDAKLVVIEFLSALCPDCHANAPVVNKLYKVVQKDAVLARDVKIIGICIGNEKAEIDAFKKKLKVSFPLLSDEDSSIAQALGVMITPTMVLVTPSGKVLWSHSGVVRDFDGLLKEIRENHKKL